MHVLEWLLAPFDKKIDYKGDFEEELIEMHVDLKAKLLFKGKNLTEYWNNINTANKCPKLRAAAKPFLLAFPTLCMVKADFSYMNTILTKHRNRLCLQNRGDFRQNLTNFQPNIDNLAAVHQAHPSHYSNYFTTKIC